MKILPSFFLILLLSILVIPSIAQDQSTSILDQKFTVAQLQEDFDIFRRNVEDYQPGLYQYTSKEKLDQAFDAARAALNQPMNSAAFLRIVCPTLKLIANGHTQLVGSAAYYKAMRESFIFFPFQLHRHDGQVYILRNLSSQKDIPSGALIKSINGEEIKQIFQELEDFQTRDGFNQSLPQAKVNHYFARNYGLYKGFPEQFDIEIQETKDSPLKKYTVQAVTEAEGRKIYEERYGKINASAAQKPAIDFSIDQNIATLTIRTFDGSAYKKEKIKTKKIFKEYFEKMEIAGVEHLIIDLRNNGGGDPQPTENLFAHLYDQTFTFYKEISAKVKKIPRNEPYLKLGFGERFLNSLIFKKQGDQFIGRKIIPGLKPTQPAKTQFKGQVYVLTNANSFSATGEMTGIIKNQNKAIFIGEEAGGNPVQNVSGLMAILELPHTKNRAVIPFWLWVMNVDLENNGRGVLPDHQVSPDVSDILNGVDRVMLYTLDLIKGKQVAE